MKRKSPPNENGHAKEDERVVKKDIRFTKVHFHVLSVPKAGGTPQWKAPQHVEGTVDLAYEALHNTVRVFATPDATTPTHEFKLSKVLSHTKGPERLHEVSLEAGGRTVVFGFQFDKEEDSSLFSDTVTKNGDRLLRDIDAGCSRDYFYNYAKLVNQQHMLQDTHRTGTYNRAIMNNAQDFQGKTVMDVGAGTGILSYFSAAAGARKVYACEASDMALYAQKLVKANHFEGVVEVKHMTVEDLELTEKVDVLVSEPMGTLLVNERMIETYIVARDKFLKPGGKMYPSYSTVYVAPFTDQGLHNEYCSYGTFWQQDQFFGLDMRVLQDDALEQQFAKPAVDYFDPNITLAEPNTWTCDFMTATVDSLQEITIPLHFPIFRVGIVHGLACWFDVEFRGHAQTVVLGTGPADPPTHWRQIRLLMKDPIGVNPGQTLSGSLVMRTNEFHSYDIDVTIELDGTPIRSAAKNIDLRYPAYGPFASSTPPTNTTAAPGLESLHTV